MKSVLTVLYFGNTKSEVKVTLKKFCLVLTVLVIVQEEKNHVSEILVICSPAKSGALLNGRKCMYSVVTPPTTGADFVVLALLPP